MKKKLLALSMLTCTFFASHSMFNDPDAVINEDAPGIVLKAQIGIARVVWRGQKLSITRPMGTAVSLSAGNAAARTLQLTICNLGMLHSTNPMRNLAGTVIGGQPWSSAANHPTDVPLLMALHTFLISYPTALAAAPAMGVAALQMPGAFPVVFGTVAADNGRIANTGLLCVNTHIGHIGIQADGANMGVDSGGALAVRTAPQFLAACTPANILGNLGAGLNQCNFINTIALLTGVYAVAQLYTFGRINNVALAGTGGNPLPWDDVGIECVLNLYKACPL